MTVIESAQVDWNVVASKLEGRTAMQVRIRRPRSMACDVLTELNNLPSPCPRPKINGDRRSCPPSRRTTRSLASEAVETV